MNPNNPNPEEPLLVYRPKRKQQEESKQSESGMDVMNDTVQSEAQPQSDPPAGKTVRPDPQPSVRTKKEDTVNTVAKQYQDKFNEAASKGRAAMLLAFQNPKTEEPPVDDQTAFLLDKFNSNVENSTIMEFQQLPVVHPEIDIFGPFNAKDVPTFNQMCPISKQDYVSLMQPIIVLGQLQRHVTTLAQE